MGCLSNKGLGRGIQIFEDFGNKKCSASGGSYGGIGGYGLS